MPGPAEPAAAELPATAPATPVDPTTETDQATETAPIGAPTGGELPVAPMLAEAVQPPKTTRANSNPCAGEPAGSFVHGGTCKINICHATGSESHPYEFITINTNGLNGHFNPQHQQGEDIIGVSGPAACEVAPPPCETDCDPDPCEGEPAGSFPQGGACKINICHATGSASNPYEFITISTNALGGHFNPQHQQGEDIIGVTGPADCPGPVDACPDELNPGYQEPGTTCITDACPDELNPGDQPYGTVCIVDACPDALNPGNQPIGTVCITDACPDELNPGDQPYGTTCITDACPDALNPGNQPPGTTCVTDACPGDLNPGDQPWGTSCIVDACPDALNPGIQPFGTTCITDACPDVLNPGNQPYGTTCIADACPDALNPGLQAPGTTCVTAPPTITPTPTPAVEVVVPVATPDVEDVPEAGVGPEAETSIPVVLGESAEPEAAVDTVASAGDLPFTGARTALLSALGVLTFLFGSALMRRRSRAAR